MAGQYGVYPPTPAGGGGGGGGTLTQSQFTNSGIVPLAVSSGVVTASLNLSATAAGAGQAKITLSIEADGLLGLLTTGNLSGTAPIVVTGGTGVLVGSNASVSVTSGHLVESTSSVLTIMGGTGSQLGSGTTIEVKQASGSQSGYLSSANWTTFNSKEGAITSGTTAQYWRGDKSFQTLNQAAVAGLTTADSPTFVNATLSGKTIGSVIFAGTSGVLSQDNATFFWDNTNKRLGLGTTSPSVRLQVDVATAGTGNDSLSVQNSAATSVGHTVGMRFRLSGVDASAIRSSVTNAGNGASSLMLMTAVDPTLAGPVEQLTITNTGELRTPNIHNNGGTQATACVASGTYTPAFVSGTAVNISPNPTFSVAQWIRVGQVVTVSGKINIDPSLAGASSSFGFTVPIASTFTDGTQCSGVACTQGYPGYAARIYATSTYAILEWNKGGSGSLVAFDWSFTMTYLIL